VEIHKKKPGKEEQVEAGIPAPNPLGIPPDATTVSATFTKTKKKSVEGAGEWIEAAQHGRNREVFKKYFPDVYNKPESFGKDSFIDAQRPTEATVQCYFNGNFMFYGLIVNNGLLTVGHDSFDSFLVPFTRMLYKFTPEQLVQLKNTRISSKAKDGNSDVVWYHGFMFHGAVTSLKKKDLRAFAPEDIGQKALIAHPRTAIGTNIAGRDNTQYGVEITHSVHTQSGSCGLALVALDGKVVGIHHLGGITHELNAAAAINQDFIDQVFQSGAPQVPTHSD
jgi:hypothetical protein